MQLTNFFLEMYYVNNIDQFSP